MLDKSLMAKIDIIMFSICCFLYLAIYLSANKLTLGFKFSFIVSAGSFIYWVLSSFAKAIISKNSNYHSNSDSKFNSNSNSSFYSSSKCNSKCIEVSKV